MEADDQVLYILVGNMTSDLIYYSISKKINYFFPPTTYVRSKCFIKIKIIFIQKYDNSQKSVFLPISNCSLYIHFWIYGIDSA